MSGQSGESDNDNLRSKKTPRKSWLISSIFVLLIVVLGFGMLYYVAINMKPVKPTDGKDGAPGSEQKGEEAKKPEEMPKVKAYKVGKERFIHVLDTLGSIQAKSKVELRFEVNGLVDVVSVKEGDQVRNGDVVSELTHSDAELKVDFRKSKLKEAQIEEKNWKVKVQQNQELLDAGAITQAKFDEGKFAHERAQQAVKSAKIELQSAEAELDKTYLRSPIDGIVGEVKTHKGEFVSSQSKVMFLMEISEVYCEFSVLEKDIQDVKEGLDIFMTVDTYPGEKFKGAILSMGSIVTTVEGRSRKVKALISNEEHKLLPGMFSHVEIVLLQRDDALTVPVSAFPDIEKDTSTVWVIGEGDKVQKREISVEHFNMEKALVESGVNIGDLVVIDVATVKLEEGKQVEIIEVREPQAAEKM
ncbi:MAG: Secretion protein HlyD [uncultured bacterium]|nr:MAG: Secretion protein HlyD [uncultured bacterium]